MLIEKSEEKLLLQACKETIISIKTFPSFFKHKLVKVTIKYDKINWLTI